MAGHYLLLIGLFHVCVFYIVIEMMAHTVFSLLCLLLALHIVWTDVSGRVGEGAGGTHHQHLRSAMGR